MSMTEEQVQPETHTGCAYTCRAKLNERIDATPGKINNYLVIIVVRMLSVVVLAALTAVSPAPRRSSCTAGLVIIVNNLMHASEELLRGAVRGKSCDTKECRRNWRCILAMPAFLLREDRADRHQNALHLYTR
eukprot:gb/GECG01003856.1/.p1 GENE.gb/GECG01003856.1/~~gb/GECG01003856.1/.p1  ORF type:complete len:133 (+),score=4.35 gb/GECG01003856.1/:1-399(+)